MLLSIPELLHQIHAALEVALHLPRAFLVLQSSPFHLQIEYGFRAS